MTKHNILHGTIITLLFFLLCSPLFVASSLYFPYVTGKVFWFRLIVAVVACLWIILAIKDNQFMPRKSLILLATGLFLDGLFLSNIFGVDSSNSFFSNYERMEGWFTILFFFLYLVVISVTFTTQKIWNRFFFGSTIIANILVLCAISPSFAKIFDITGAQSRTNIFLGNSTYVAIYVLFNIFFALIFLYKALRKKNWKSAFSKYVISAYSIFTILAGSYVVFKTQTRGTVLALVFSIILFLILSTITYWKNKKVRYGAIILGIIAVIGVALFWINRDAQFIQQNPLLVRVATISATEGTGKARMMNWGIALQGIQEKPILGWGQENYIYVFPKFYNPDMYGQEPWFDRTHNVFLDWTIQGGIVALILYISIFVLAVWAIIKSKSLPRIEKNILVSLLFAYSIHNLFVFDNYSSYLMFFSVLGYIIFHQRVEVISINWAEKTKQLVGVVLAVTIVSVAYLVVIKPWRASVLLIDALSATTDQGSFDAEKSLELFESAYTQNSFGELEISTRLFGEAQRFASIDNPELFDRYMDMAFERGEKLVYENPNDVRILELYGTFLLQQNRGERAIELLERARTLSPNRQNNLYVLSFAYITFGKNEEAIEVLKHAYEVAPSNIKARQYYGASLLLDGNSEEGFKLLQGYSYRDSFFLSIFNETKQYKEVIKILEQRIKDNPTAYQMKISLAVAYLYDEQREKAVEIIRSIQEDVPEFKEQGDYLIGEIQAGKNPVR